MEEKIIQHLVTIKELLKEQSILQKEILSLDEACQYLDYSKSHLYKLTSTRRIPFYCPEGKRIYFKRLELDEWLLRNPVQTQDTINQQASDYLVRCKYDTL